MCLFQIKFCQTLIPIPYVYSYLAQEVSLYKIYPTLLFHNVFIIIAVRRQAIMYGTESMQTISNQM